MRRHQSCAVLESSGNSPFIALVCRILRWNRQKKCGRSTSTSIPERRLGSKTSCPFVKTSWATQKEIGIWCSALCAVAAMRSRPLLHLLQNRKWRHWDMISCRLVPLPLTATSTLFRIAKALLSIRWKRYQSSSLRDTKMYAADVSETSDVDDIRATVGLVTFIFKTGSSLSCHACIRNRLPRGRRP